MPDRPRVAGWGCAVAIVLAVATAALLVAALVTDPDEEAIEVTPDQRALVVCANLRSSTQRVTDSQAADAEEVIELLRERSLTTSLWRDLPDDHFVALCELAEGDTTATYAADDEGRAQRIAEG